MVRRPGHAYYSLLLTHCSPFSLPSSSPSLLLLLPPSPPLSFPSLALPLFTSICIPQTLLNALLSLTPLFPSFSPPSFSPSHTSTLQLTSFCIPHTLLNVPPHLLQLLVLTIKLAHLTLNKLCFTEPLLLSTSFLDGDVTRVVCSNEWAGDTLLSTILPLCAL